MGETRLIVRSDDMLSSIPSDEKVGSLIDLIGRLGPGTHLIVSHCAVDSSELRAMTTPDAENAPWANEYRVSDLAALTDDSVRRAVDAKGVDVVSVADVVPH